MIRIPLRNLTAFVLIAVLAACAGNGESRRASQEIDVYERHAGAAESWVRYGNIRNWWSVGLNSLVLEMNRSRHYLVRLIGACDLRLSGVGLELVTSRRNVISDFDRVVVDGQSCQIQSIRRLDYEAVKADLEARGEQVPDGEAPAAVKSEDQSSSGGT